MTLADVGAAAGVSRGTPGWAFGSKEALYAAVVQRAFAARDGALAPVFAPLAAWARAAPEAAGPPLAGVVREAVDGYLAFLAGRPSFVALVGREALDGGARLAATPHASSVMEDAFAALRDGAARHGLRAFDVADVVVALVSLCLTPFAHRDTLLRRLGRDPDDPPVRAAIARQATEVVLLLVGADPGDGRGGRGAAAERATSPRANLLAGKQCAARRSTTTSAPPTPGSPPSGPTSSSAAPAWPGRRCCSAACSRRRGARRGRTRRPARTGWPRWSGARARPRPPAAALARAVAERRAARDARRRPRPRAGARPGLRAGRLPRALRRGPGAERRGGARARRAPRRPRPGRPAGRDGRAGRQGPPARTHRRRARGRA